MHQESSNDVATDVADTNIHMPIIEYNSIAPFLLIIDDELSIITWRA